MSIVIAKTDMGLSAFLQYEFIQRAFVAGAFVAVLCAVLGLFLVLRKMSMIGDGLAHVSFGAIALGLLFGVYPFIVAVPVAVIGSLLILFIAKRARLFGDAAIGMVSALGIAAGVTFASLSRGFNVDLMSYLFGNILSITAAEMWMSIGLSAVVIAVIALFYHDLFSATLDEEYAKVSGIRIDRLNGVLAALTAVSVVLSVRIVGVMLVSALLILPAATALQVARSFRSALFFAVVSAVLSVVIGIAASFVLDLPSGATVVLVGFALFLVAFVLRVLGKR